MTGMNRLLSPSICAAAALLIAGCGSGSSTGSSSGTSGSTSAASATTSAASAPGTSTTSGSTTSPSNPSGGIKVNTTPRYASPSRSAPIQSGLVQIAYRNIAIDPDTLRVKVGSTLRWTNEDSVEHNVTSKEGPEHFASQNFGEGKTFEFKVTKPGVIHYVCTIHPVTMNGTIEVVG
jgi:plastocyanin